MPTQRTDARSATKKTVRRGGNWDKEKKAEVHADRRLHRADSSAQMATKCDDAEGPFESVILDIIQRLWQHWMRSHRHADVDKHWVLAWNMPHFVKRRHVDAAKDNGGYWESQESGWHR